MQCTRAQYKLSDLFGRLDSAKFSLQINELVEVLLTEDRIETSTLYIVTANIYNYKTNSSFGKKMN